ncbi:MAG TPA: M20 family metallopeptidase [Thermoanaerobaculia bacterium]|nr:M20 family metallopeptidase [Thermoanaerobaculia bacterium]
MSRFVELLGAELYSTLVALRRDLHRHPELSFEERRTAQRLVTALEGFSPRSIERVGETGVVARFAGEDARAPAVAVRGDIDALPIQEETGLEWGSEVPGVMHACGHDVHATWAVGAGALLARRPAGGDVLVVLQPAEEVGQGAAEILRSGLLDGVRAIFGGHVDRRFEVGEVVTQEGSVGAATDEFFVELVGRGGHGARPHLGRDPVVAGSALVTALQTIVSRRIEPGAPAVVTVGTFRAGTATNVIPSRAHLSGTLRAMDPATRALLARDVEEVARGIAAAHGVELELKVREGTPAVINDPAATAWARSAAEGLLGAEAIKPLGTINMGGEDFAFYLERIPGCFARIGAREPGGEPIGAHTPRFVAAEESIAVGAAWLAETARLASKALAQGD